MTDTKPASREDELITWGILGTGSMAGRMVSCIRAMGGEVVAIGSRAKNSAQRFANEHNIGQTYDSYAALAREADVDAVYIATTNDQHFQNAMACLQHGRAVLCEKPLTITVEQTQALIDAARSARVLLVEAMWMRFQPFVPLLDKLIDEDTIGPVNLLEAHFSFPIQEAPESRWYDPKLGGGSLLDLGVYPLTLAHYILGAPQTSVAVATLASTGVDSQCAVSSTHALGAVSTLSCSFSVAGAAEAMIAGERGRIRLTSPFFHCPKMVLETASVDAPRSIDTEYHGDGLECEIAEFHRCLRESLLESPLMPHADSVAIASWRMSILEQIGIRYPA